MKRVAAPSFCRGFVQDLVASSGIISETDRDRGLALDLFSDCCEGFSGIKVQARYASQLSFNRYATLVKLSLSRTLNDSHNQKE